MLLPIERLIPAALHRALLPVAHRVRHWWRLVRRDHLQGCVVVVEDFNQSVLLLRHSYGPKLWSLPGGGVKPGEDPQMAALRELGEELGEDLVLAADRLSLLGVLQDEISGSPHTAHVFYLRTDAHPKPDLREVLEAQFYPLHSLPAALSPRASKALDLRRAQRGI
ncbi:MAG: NUDIX domain-containing protein [Erythrobacter sp.]